MDKPSIIAGRDGNAGGDYLIGRGSLESSSEYNGMTRWTAGVGSATCMESAAVKVGKVPWDAEALPHSEGVAYKVIRNRSVPTGLADGVIVSDDGPRQHNSDRSQGPLG
jgi:hypothetical protein